MCEVKHEPESRFTVEAQCCYVSRK